MHIYKLSALIEMEAKSMKISFLPVGHPGRPGAFLWAPWSRSWQLTQTIITLISADVLRVAIGDFTLISTLQVPSVASETGRASAYVERNTFFPFLPVRWFSNLPRHPVQSGYGVRTEERPQIGPVAQKDPGLTVWQRPGCLLHEINLRGSQLPRCKPLFSPPT